MRPRDCPRSSDSMTHAIALADQNHQISLSLKLAACVLSFRVSNPRPELDQALSLIASFRHNAVIQHTIYCMCDLAQTSSCESDQTQPELTCGLEPDRAISFAPCCAGWTDRVNADHPSSIPNCCFGTGRHEPCRLTCNSHLDGDVMLPWAASSTNTH